MILPETVPDGSYRLRTFNYHKAAATVATVVRDVEGAEGQQGPEGEPGTDGQDGTSCSVSQGAGGVTVICTDGTTAAVFDGAPGANGVDGMPGFPGIPGADGQDGTSCSVAQSASSATVNCTDGTSAIVFDGVDGVQGPPGQSVGLVNEVCGLYELTGNSPPASLISETSEATCADGIDNDCDGQVDLDDFDCGALGAAPVLSSANATLTGGILLNVSVNGQDSDGDAAGVRVEGFIDFGGTISSGVTFASFADPVLGETAPFSADAISIDAAQEFSGVIRSVLVQIQDQAGNLSNAILVVDP